MEFAEEGTMIDFVKSFRHVDVQDVCVIVLLEDCEDVV